MSSRRDEMLKEMGLTPVWRLRVARVRLRADEPDAPAPVDAGSR